MPRPSRRFDLLPPYVFTEMFRTKAEAVAAKGLDVIDLGIGDPDSPTPTPIVDELKRTVDEPGANRYDEAPKGMASFLNAATTWYAKRFGPQLDPQTEALMLIGSKEGLAHLAWAYCDPGDVAIVPNPAYSVYANNALMAGASTHDTPLRPANAFLPDFTEIPSSVAKNAKLFYVCYPNNPTGAVAPIEFFEDAVRFCREYDILLVSDMAYCDVTFDGYECPSALQVEGAKEVTLEIFSLSKSFNMTGWRLGYALGSPDAIRYLTTLKSNIDTRHFKPILMAGALAVSQCDNRDTLKLYEKRRAILVQGLGAAGWPVAPPRASFYVWARVPRDDMTSSEFCRELLLRTGVLIIPGSGYGSEGEGYCRISLTVTNDHNGERIAEAVRRIASCGLLRP